MRGVIKGDMEIKLRKLTLLGFFQSAVERIITIVANVSLRVLLLLFPAVNSQQMC